jgi:hypothetical protein
MNSMWRGPLLAPPRTWTCAQSACITDGLGSNGLLAATNKLLHAASGGVADVHLTVL